MDGNTVVDDRHRARLADAARERLVAGLFKADNAVSAGVSRRHGPHGDAKKPAALARPRQGTVFLWALLLAVPVRQRLNPG